MQDCIFYGLYCSFKTDGGATEPVAAEQRENCGRSAHAISMRKICELCNKPNARPYDLRVHVVIPGRAKKQKIAQTQRVFSGATF